MPTIAGYADLAEIKGQYYRYAGCPIPVASSTVNVNTDLENLIAKAIIVTKGQNGGDLPPELGSYLLTTVEYGNSNYLQTAYSVTSGYEYRRFKFGATAWKDWKDATLYGANDTTELQGKVRSQGNAIDKINNETIPNLIDSNNTYTIKKAMGNAEIANTTANDALTLAQSANSRIDTNPTYTSWGMAKSSGPWNISSISAARSGNVVSMSMVFSVGKNTNVNPGGNGFEGILSSGGPLPAIAGRLSGFYGQANIICNISSNGSTIVRVTGNKINPGAATTVNVVGTFVVPNDGTVQESTPEPVTVQWDELG